MKTKDEIQNILTKHKDVIFNRFHVDSIGVFGSNIKNNNTNKSDIDILVHFSKPAGQEFIELNEYLENILNSEFELIIQHS